MAGEGRRQSGFADALGDFDSDDWAGKAQPAKPRPDPARMRETAELVGFKSREGGKVAPAPAGVKLRRNHSGRSEQINVKATPDYKARFDALVKKHSWTSVVLMEKLIELGERQLK